MLINSILRVFGKKIIVVNITKTGRKVRSDKGKTHKRHPNKGKKRSDETRLKMMYAWDERKKNAPKKKANKKINNVKTKRTISEETRRKLSESNKGKKRSEETRRRIGEANRRRVISDETRRRMSESHKVNKLSEETKSRKTMSEQARRNISEGLKRYHREQRISSAA